MAHIVITIEIIGNQKLTSKCASEIGGHEEEFEHGIFGNFGHGFGHGLGLGHRIRQKVRQTQISDF